MVGRLLHAGQLRYHDYSKLRELQDLASGRFSNKAASPLFQLEQQRPFLTSFNSRLGDLRLKTLERVANQNPLQTDLQYDFVSQLAQRHPHVAVERYQMAEFALDERLAAVYLKSMHVTQNYQPFQLDKLVARLQQSNLADPIKIEALQELSLQTKGLTKAKQVAAALNILGSPIGVAEAGLASTASVGALGARGLDPKAPLYVQLQNSVSARSAMFTLARHVLVAFLVVSALTAIMDEKGKDGLHGRWSQAEPVRHKVVAVKARGGHFLKKSKNCFDVWEQIPETHILSRLPIAAMETKRAHCSTDGLACASEPGWKRWNDQTHVEIDKMVALLSKNGSSHGFNSGGISYHDHSSGSLLGSNYLGDSMPQSEGSNSRGFLGGSSLCMSFIKKVNGYKCQRF